jgi:hypothetical protein
MLMDDKIVKLEERNSNFNLKEVGLSPLSFPLFPPNQQTDPKAFIETLIKELTILR